MRRLLMRRYWVVLASVFVVALGALGCAALSEEESTGGSSTSGLLSEETTSTDASVSTTTSVVSTTMTGASTTTTSASTTTTVASTTTTALSVAASEELLPDGNIRAIGYITDVWMDGSVRMLKIDYIDYFSGAEADAAAIEDGVIQPGEHAENGWYMRNNNPLLRTYVVSHAVAIATSSRDNQEGDWDPPCSWSDFLSFWGPPGGLSFNDAQIHGSKWWIERQGNTVVSITEKWTP